MLLAKHHADTAAYYFDRQPPTLKEHVRSVLGTAGMLREDGSVMWDRLKRFCLFVRPGGDVPCLSVYLFERADQPGRYVTVSDDLVIEKRSLDEADDEYYNSVEAYTDFGYKVLHRSV